MSGSTFAIATNTSSSKLLAHLPNVVDAIPVIAGGFAGWKNVSRRNALLTAAGSNAAAWFLSSSSLVETNKLLFKAYAAARTARALKAAHPNKRDLQKRLNNVLAAYSK